MLEKHIATQVSISESYYKKISSITEVRRKENIEKNVSCIICYLLARFLKYHTTKLNTEKEYCVTEKQNPDW